MYGCDIAGGTTDGAWAKPGVPEVGFANCGLRQGEAACGVELSVGSVPTGAKALLTGALYEASATAWLFGWLEI
jgi:hypothetical protein